jgi:transcriptional regulator with XRE-family HTH domain
MSDQDVPKADAVGRRLVALRKERGLSAAELGRLVGFSQSKVSKIETGAVRVKAQDVRAIADVLGLSPAEKTELADLTLSAHVGPDTWGAVHTQANLAAREAQATRFRLFAAAVPPGLLHTAEYASSVLADYQLPPGEAPEPMAVASAVTERMRRQEILADPSKTFEFVMTEETLRNRLAPPAVMLGQVERIRWAAKQPNQHVRIVPSDTELRHAPLHDFEMLDDRAAIIDTVTITVLSREPTELAVYRRVFESFWAQATEDVGPILDRYARLYADLARPAD